MICSTTYRTALSVAGSVILTLGTFSLLLAASPADAPRSEIVRYHEVDLDRPADAARLYKRIHTAAERVCSPLPRRDLVLRPQRNHCLDAAVADAVAKVAHPRLSALHSATIGRWQAANERRARPGV